MLQSPFQASVVKCINTLGNTSKDISKKALLAILTLSILTGCGGNQSDNEVDVSKTETTTPASQSVESDSHKVADETKSDTPATKADSASAKVKADSADDTTKTSTTKDSTTKDSTTQPALAADAGKKLYDKSCKVCHDSGLLDSPKIGDKGAWASRIAKGTETLYKHSAQGYNKMPPQAVNGVSEVQIKAAVDYMIERSK